MNDITLGIIMGILLLFVVFILPEIRLRRNIPYLIRIFREAKADVAKNAKTVEELGLKPLSITHSLFGGGIPVQNALQVLKQAKIIQSTEDGKMYLSEENLASSKWHDK
jgi:hypothetical protein